MTAHRFHALSRPGGRSINQDCWGTVERDALCGWLLADGLGGHGGGEVAAELAIRAASDAVANGTGAAKDAVKHVLKAANEAVVKAQSGDTALASMRTTLVALFTEGSEAVWSWVGDSRLYYLKDGRIAYVTKDHSLPQKLVDIGQIAPEAIRDHPDRNRLLRALGGEGSLSGQNNVKFAELTAGDVFLLCSDGFWELVLEQEMEVDLAKASDPEGWLSCMEDRLLRRVDERRLADHDNYTAIAVFIA